MGMKKFEFELKKIRDLQRVSVEKSPDDYNVGIYNGLELALSICEKREPVFMFCDNDAQVVSKEDEKEKLGRTVASGKRMCKGNVVDENV